MKHIPSENGIHQERPEDPEEEVIQETEEWWKDNDLYVRGDRRDE